MINVPEFFEIVRSSVLYDDFCSFVVRFYNTYSALTFQMLFLKDYVKEPDVFYLDQRFEIQKNGNDFITLGQILNYFDSFITVTFSDVDYLLSRWLPPHISEETIASIKLAIRI